MKRPYVGISGVVSPEMQTSLENMALESGIYGRGRLLALGVKAVHKTQMLGIENKYGHEWYPVGEEAFKNALRHDETPNPNTIAVTQTYLDIDHVEDPDYRNEFLRRIVDRGQPWMQAIQFDMLPWHTDSKMWGFLEKVKEENVQVFLQAHRNAMETLGPKGTVRMLGRYAHLLDYVLFDSSHGTGKRLDAAALERFISEAHNGLDLSQTGVAIAGGLNGQVVRQDLPELIDEYPNLSWDAEGQLHPTDANGKRPLDMTKTRDYLEASAEVLRTSSI